MSYKQLYAKESVRHWPWRIRTLQKGAHMKQNMLFEPLGLRVLIGPVMRSADEETDAKKKIV